MRELDIIIANYEKAKKEDRPIVLATVVHVEGSSYRRAGARMLVDEMGNMTGAISGGCLEGDALRKALHALYQNQNKLITYDTSDEEDAVIGAQLGCNGVIQVLFEPVSFADSGNPVEILKEAQCNEISIVGTFFHLDRAQEQIGTSFWIQADTKVNGQLEPGLESQLIEDSQVAFEQGTSLFREYQTEETNVFVFLELFKPPIKLVLVGAGNDAQVTAQMAELLGWEIVVTDGRPSHAKADRFVSSCQVIVSKPQEVLDTVVMDTRTAFVLITHNYNYDLAVLKLLLEQEQLRYVGVLGPKKKYTRMLDELGAQGVEISEEQLAKVHAPVGLELGAETPAEIALSILSEIQAVFTNTEGAFLKEKEGPIHQLKNNEFKKTILTRST